MRSVRTNVRSEGRSLAERIRGAAAETFAQFGFHAAGMRDIARAAGVSIGALYHYFPSKEQVFLAVLRREYERHLATAQHLLRQGLPAAEVLRRVIATHFEALAPGRGVGLFARAWGTEAPELQPHLQALREEYAGAVGDLLRQAMDRGELRRGHPLVLAYALLGLVEAVTARAVGDDPVAAEFRRLGSEELANLVWRGLRAEREAS
ncbi:MAG: hypothetical protein BIP78_1352 [Candidatus Bipolaricaulis sibiricus]|uniref:HTH tetR-type domain-containing protein n=1 Tax=Bipolaricaulis sibiricus TaxID=2501609 RepID=A0A410FVZ8_BIPS1|nr:MAG: hypothetical protein BIP78_1352 [Candidatus Bipolaricaulis sibiricus]